MNSYERTLRFREELKAAGVSRSEYERAMTIKRIACRINGEKAWAESVMQRIAKARTK